MSDGWTERLGWAWDLISYDPARREAAHRILDEARVAYSDALARYNGAWGRPEARARTDELRTAMSHLLPEALWASPPPPDLGVWPGTPYMLLYLQWEQRFVGEWTWHAKYWSAKTSILRDLAHQVQRLDQRHLAELSDLVLQVVARPQRVGDEWYARLAQVLSRQPLYEQLLALAESEDPGIRERAGYLLLVLDGAFPGRPSLRQWQRYLREHHGRDRHVRVRGSTGVPWFERDDEVLVRCPRCDGLASVRRDPNAPPADGRTWRAWCTECDYADVRVTRQARCAGPATELIFGYPLWLQAECHGGHLFCVDNLEKLERFDRYLRARVDLRSGAQYGTVPAQTYLSSWMMQTSRRSELLAVIGSLRDSVRERSGRFNTQSGMPHEAPG
ncbi:hypothetical protein AB0M47_04935 [Hamadaea sp. NPDC051192]|uniref:hypothetical protein n=1 Tax=Hamadaea sp. NPDC051192 TaxID=3154940 RepID=UPI003437D85D